ncbi:MAG: hypothetical protein QOG52_817 [Frankiaceae bacterium]|nr:hypothetical protein [Frankiaceae bacterium]
MSGTAWHPREGRGVVPLRPLSVAEILDAPFAAMRRYPAPMIGVGAIVATIVGGGSLAWRLSLHDWALEHFNVDGAATIGLALSVAAILVVLVAAGWQTALTADAMIGRESSAAQVWDAVRPRIWTLILAAGVAVLPAAIFIGFLILAAWIGAVGGVLAVLFALPAIWLAIVGQFLGPIVVMEGVGIRAAVPRAFSLLRGSWWRCFWMLWLSSFTGTLVGLGVLLPFEAGTVGFLTGGVISGDSVIVRTVLPAIAVILVYAIVLPFIASVVAVLYLDVRIRTEAFDLTVTGAIPTATPTTGR